MLVDGEFFLPVSYFHNILLTQSPVLSSLFPHSHHTNPSPILSHSVLPPRQTPNPSFVLPLPTTPSTSPPNPSLASSATSVRPDPPLPVSSSPVSLSHSLFFPLIHPSPQLTAPLPLPNALVSTASVTVPLPPQNSRGRHAPLRTVQRRRGTLVSRTPTRTWTQHPMTTTTLTTTPWVL